MDLLLITAAIVLGPSLLLLAAWWLAAHCRRSTRRTVDEAMWPIGISYGDRVRIEGPDRTVFWEGAASYLQRHRTQDGAILWVARLRD